MLTGTRILYLRQCLSLKQYGYSQKLQGEQRFQALLSSTRYLAQNSKNEYTITAVEHYDEKFKAVDEDFTTFIADTVYPVVTDTDIVPPPVDVFCTTEMKPESVGEELIVSWTHGSKGRGVWLAR